MKNIDYCLVNWQFEWRILRNEYWNQLYLNQHSFLNIRHSNYSLGSSQYFYTVRRWLPYNNHYILLWDDNLQKSVFLLLDDNLTTTITSCFEMITYNNHYILLWDDNLTTTITSCFEMITYNKHYILLRDDNLQKSVYPVMRW